MVFVANVAVSSLQGEGDLQGGEVTLQIAPSYTLFICLIGVLNILLMSR